MSKSRRAIARVVGAIGCIAVAIALVPRWWCGREADRYFEGRRDVQIALADQVAHTILEHPDATFYDTGNPRFDGQSAVAIYQMALLGLGQVVLQHPAERPRLLPAMRRAADRLVDPATLRYAADVYGDHGVVRMDPGEGHAYLGYVNLGLGMLRAVDPGTPHAALHDDLTEQLAQRLFASEDGLIETYPGESWPPDVAAVVGSIGLHAAVTGRSRAADLDAWAKRFVRCAIDESSGYVVQRVNSGTCEPADAPRGSGTAVAGYFISFACPALARRLHEAIAAGGLSSVLGFGLMREYPAGRSGRGDTNSGPVLFGLSVGATGFALASARLYGDRPLFLRLYRSVSLFGVPTSRGGGAWFATGGALGNALLLAMLTARTP